MRLMSVLVTAICWLTCVPAFAAVEVVTTTPDLAYFAQAIGGDRVRVEALARPQEDVHAVQVKPSFLAKLNKADLFVTVGLELDSWASALQSKSANPSIRTGGKRLVVASRGVQLLDIPVGKVDRAMGDIHPAGNPHCWLSASNAKLMARNIRDGLVRIDPAGQPVYDGNLAVLAISIDQTAREAKALLERIPGRQVIQQHATFAYLFQWLGVTTSGVIEQRPGIAPGAGHLTSLAALMQQQQVSVVVTEVSLNQKAAKSLAAKSGATVVVLGQHVGSLPGTDTWEALVLENARRLAVALQGGAS